MVEARPVSVPAWMYPTSRFSWTQKARRMWLSAGTIIVCVVAAHLIWRNPISSSAGGISSYSTAGWSDYLQQTFPIYPSRCSYGERSPALLEEFGEDKLLRALSSAGTGARMQRFLEKAKSGQPWTMGSMGGSISWGHGNGCEEGDLAHCEKNMHRRVFDHLNALYPAPNGTSIGEDGRAMGKNSFVNGAIRGTGSGYFAFCWKDQIPSDSDIVMLEFGVNDQPTYGTMNAFELLLRSILDMEGQPAVINFQTNQLWIKRPTRNGGDIHLPVAAYLDVPHISWRNIMLPEIEANASIIPEWYTELPTGWRSGQFEPAPEGLETIDMLHFNERGHRLAGNLVNAYIDMEICRSSWRQRPVLDLPAMALSDAWYPGTKSERIQPTCQSTNSERNPLVPISSEGWEPWSWETKHYIVAKTPGAKISFPVHISAAVGMLQLSFLKSAKYGLGQVQCWVDDEIDKAVTLSGFWYDGRSIAVQEIIRADLKPGDYVLNCQVLAETADPGNGTEFRIVAVMGDYCMHFFQANRAAEMSDASEGCTTHWFVVNPVDVGPIRDFHYISIRALPQRMMANPVALTPHDAVSGSRTITHDSTQAGPSTPHHADPELQPVIGVLKLRGAQKNRQRVVWSDNTVDNEHLGKKKSKICCIYHKPRRFDESSDESDSSSDDDSEDQKDVPKSTAKGKGKALRKDETGDTFEEASSESDGGAGDGRARPAKAPRRKHRHAHDCSNHAHPAKANKYDHHEANGGPPIQQST